MHKLDEITQNAYRHCLRIASSHYENFPVASRLLNQTLRYPIAAVYAFARSADDFADEGEHTVQQRLRLLDDYQSELSRLEQWCSAQTEAYQDTDKAIFIALADVIRRYELPIYLFEDLLKAFKQDVLTKRYQSFSDILAYCQLSANPVGRILLYLNQRATSKNFLYSDAICTGLQLINFYQDIAQDIHENDRLYIPLEEMQQFGVSLDDFRERRNTQQTQSLLDFQLQRTKQVYYSGRPLCFNLSGRFALEIRTIYSGGELILNKLISQTDKLYQRPRLTRSDKLKLLWRALRFK